MSKRAFDKIAAGLNDALAFARGDGGTTIIHRRALLGASALLPLAACGIVTTTTTNGVTTITVNVARVDAWAQAGANAATLIADLPGIAATPASVAILGIVALVKLDAGAFDKAANGQTVLTFDANSVPASIASLASDARTLLGDARAALPNVASTAMNDAQTYVNAVQTLVSLFDATVGGVKVGAVPAPMTEAQALAVLGVKAPR